MIGVSCSQQSNKQHQQNKQLLTAHKWVLSLDALMDKMIAKNPAIEKQRPVLMTNLKKSIGNTFLEFRPNGDMRAKLPTVPQTVGTWKLNTKGTELTTRFNQQESLMVIKRISADKLSLEVKNAPNAKAFQLELIAAS